MAFRGVESNPYSFYLRSYQALAVVSVELRLMNDLRRGESVPGYNDLTTGSPIKDPGEENQRESGGFSS